MSQARLADAGAVTSIGGWFVSMAVQAAPFIQDLAGIIAIVAGVFAIRFHVVKTAAIKRGKPE